MARRKKRYGLEPIVLQDPTRDYTQTKLVVDGMVGILDTKDDATTEIALFKEDMMTLGWSKQRLDELEVAAFNSCRWHVRDPLPGRF